MTDVSPLTWMREILACCDIHYYYTLVLFPLLPVTKTYNMFESQSSIYFALSVFIMAEHIHNTVIDFFFLA